MHKLHKLRTHAVVFHFPIGTCFIYTNCTSCLIRDATIGVIQQRDTIYTAPMTQCHDANAYANANDNAVPYSMQSHILSVLLLYSAFFFPLSSSIFGVYIVCNRSLVIAANSGYARPYFHRGP